MRLDGIKIGLVEDDPIMGGSLEQALELAGAEVIWWQSAEEALKALPLAGRDIVLCDIQLPTISGDELFEMVNRYRNMAPFLFMTAFGEIDQAVTLLKKGAGDYITKPFEIDDMLDRITGLVGTEKALIETGALGPSRMMLEIEQTLNRIARARMPVLLSGETGVGKEVCARFLHGLGSQDMSPFMPVHCAAIPEHAIESELFGALQPDLHRGYAERAGRGVLFLDGIADLSLGLQPKLLRLLEEEIFFRLGDDTPQHFEARIVCSSTRNLQELVEANEFREDLFYRINTINIEIPPLRTRPEDTIWLAERFLQESCALSGKDPKSFSNDAREYLLRHNWPGNARELRNRIERANALTISQYVTIEDMFPDRNADHKQLRRLAKLSEVRETAEKHHIELALKSRNGNLSEAARALGISRTTMWEKTVKYSIKTHS